MSYGTQKMAGQPLGGNIQLSSPYAHNKQLDLIPHMLKKQNCMSELNPPPISIRVEPSTPHLTPTIASISAGHHFQQMKGQIYPTQSQAQPQQTQSHEADWSKHAIVASVAGLESKLAELDSEIRTANTSDTGFMRHIQDHATILRKNVEQTDSIKKKQREITDVTHQICSHFNDQLGSHSTTLKEYQDNISTLQHKQKNTASLAHEICSNLNENLESQVESIRGLETHLKEHSMHILQMKKKDEIEHVLLDKILTLLDKHDSQLKEQLSGDHHVLLDAMVQALEKTKGKMQNFEKTQNEMQQILADFKRGKLAPTAQSFDTQDIKARLDKYSELSRQMDLQFSHTLNSQQNKIRELEQKVHFMSSNTHQSKIDELEEKIHKLSLNQLNSSQNASISKSTDRDVKLLQHDMRNLHGLKQEVLDLKDRHQNEIKSDMHQLKSEVYALSEAHKRSNVKSDVADLQVKMQDLRREVMMQDVRIDKTQMHITDLQKKHMT
jgi:DNA repair exonuclease SbcCD ATPase subunit